MKTLIATICGLTLLMVSTTASAKVTYGSKLCNSSGYYCLKVKRGDTWDSLFPNYRERNIVMKVNRMNIALTRGMVIAVPHDLEDSDLMDFSPMPRYINSSNSNVLIVDKSELAWGAYDADGNLVNWGPMSGGKGYCPDTGQGCKTVTGKYTVYRRQGAECVSSKYPIPNGGAPMPYCFHFYKGYAFHGSYTVPGYHASHGCVRLFVDDAKWLNQNFVNVGRTRVIIEN